MGDKVSLYNYTKQINIQKLFNEIKNDGTIGSLFSGKIKATGTSVEIEMSQSLDGSQTSILDSIVSSHDSSIAPDFSNYRKIARSEFISETTRSTSSKTKLELVTDELPEGDYLLLVSYQRKGRDFTAGLIHVKPDLTEEIIEEAELLNDTGSSQSWKKESLFEEFSGISGVHKFRLDYQAKFSNHPSAIRNAKIMIWRVG